MKSRAEIDLHHVLARCPDIARLGGCVSSGLRHGVLLAQGTRSLGVWGNHDGRLVFRGLADYSPLYEAADIREARRVTVEILEKTRNGWAEREGPLSLSEGAAED